MELLRDVYYLAPARSRLLTGGDTQPLGDDEYFVLGDNSPVSQDSRDFGPASASQILGVVVPWPRTGR